MERFDFDQQEREEWRELGFYYDRDDETKIWNIYGDRSGLNNLCVIIEEYISTKENEGLGEHEHLGPYQYLKIVTSNEPMITKQGIFGSFSDLKSFAKLFKSKLDQGSVNGQFTIGNEFAKSCEYWMVFHVMPDGFDPVSMDERLSGEKQS